MALTQTSSRPLPRLTNETAEFGGYFKVEAYPHHSAVFRPADSANRVYLLKSGRVRLLKPGKTKAVLAILSPGDVFGDIQGGEMGEWAVSDGETEVWSIAGADLGLLCEGRPQLAVELLKSMDARAKRLRDRTRGLTFKQVPAYLSELILDLAGRVGVPCPHEGETDLRGVTQQDLADMVGASRAFVSTLINEMKRDKLLNNHGRVLCVRDEKGLRKESMKEK